MDDEKPLVEGRGLIRIADFCRESGLSRPAVETLLVSREVEGVFDLDGRPYGLFDDVLPSRDRLVSLGLSASATYEPEALRSVEDDTPDADEPEEPGSSTWTVSWGDPPPSDDDDRAPSYGVGQTGG